MKVGVLALQGAFREHLAILERVGVEGIEVRTLEELRSVDGIILPGGESTVMGKLLRDFHLLDPLKEMIGGGLPVFGTCAGMILLADRLTEDTTTHLRSMDIEVRRNAYGRQLGSFFTEACVEGVGEDIPMAFIRAPYIEDTGCGVEVLSRVEGNIVAAKKDNILVTSFHPELTDDMRVHRFFTEMIKGT